MYSAHQSKDLQIPPPNEDTIIAANPFDEQPFSKGSAMPMGMSRCMPPMMIMNAPMFRAMGGGPPPRCYPAGAPYPGMLPPGHPAGLSGLNGRIYPSDQPMIFSSTNPNAPPIFPCGICHREIHDNDQALMCESGCNFWYHKDCTKLSDDAFRMLNAEPCAEWVCDKCFTEKNVPFVKFK